jgi:hypothetical protein
MRASGLGNRPGEDVATRVCVGLWPTVGQRARRSMIARRASTRRALATLRYPPVHEATKHNCSGSTNRVSKSRRVQNTVNSQGGHHPLHFANCVDIMSPPQGKTEPG